MPEKEEKQGRLEEILQIKTTPQIEAALAEQIRALTKLTAEKEGVVAKGVFGLTACCNFRE